ncbi:hypothetical protein TI05_13165 [Achromatium sp. WMS3]|nr:hypothetical protein TI05_13165 [Achromatium sp. WMS3]
MIKICSQCQYAFWPYLVALFIAIFAAFLTWLTLGYSEFDATERIIGAIGMFALAGTTLSYYMTSCMERHCNHHHGTQPHPLHIERKHGHRPPPIQA